MDKITVAALAFLLGTSTAGTGAFPLTGTESSRIPQPPPPVAAGMIPATGEVWPNPRPSSYELRFNEKGIGVTNHDPTIGRQNDGGFVFLRENQRGVTGVALAT